MDCPTEELQIRAALESLPGIQGLSFDLPARVLAVKASPETVQACAQRIRQLGLDVSMLAQAPDAEAIRRATRRARWQLAAALLLAAGAELAHQLGGEAGAWGMAGLAMALGAVLLSGLGVYRKGLAALGRLDFNIHALMTVAVTGAIVIGQWPEAAMVMALYSLAELIEAGAVARAQSAISGLLALAPAQALVRMDDETWRPMPVDRVQPGQLVRVLPGERLPLDGTVVDGRGAVDQAAVTGESMPVDKSRGDEVFAGTINLSGVLEIQVTRPATDTVLARIIHAVSEAQQQRAPTQRFVDRFARVYTPAVFALALAVAVAGPWLASWTWMQAAYKALVLLVIACPCALVISTPVTVVSGLATAARRGIIIKGGAFLEEARRLQVLALDKTGTLTQGRPSLVHQQVLVAPSGPQDWHAITRGLALLSSHPVSRALQEGLSSPASAPPLAISDFAAVAGEGLQGQVDGTRYSLGQARALRSRGLMDAAAEQEVARQEALGRSVSLLADGLRVLAVYAVADTCRAEAAQAVASLKRLGVRPLMLTGDHSQAAMTVADALGIESVKAGLLPQDKLTEIRQLQQQGLVVGMAGDGANDSPALASANLSFSMGGTGTDIAKESADILVMNDDLRRLPETIALSRATHRVLWQNIALALGLKGVFLGLALAGHATMWMAVFADMGASLLVVFNGLRLLRWRV